MTDMDSVGGLSVDKHGEEVKCPKCGQKHPPDKSVPDSPEPYEIKKDKFEAIARDPSSGKIDFKNIAEVETGVAAQEAGLIGKLVPPPSTHGGLELGYDLTTDLGEEIDVKAFRPHDLRPGGLDKTIRNAQVPPAKKKILLDPRQLCDQQVKEIQKKLEDEIGKDRVIIAPRNKFRPIKVV
ncbi:hypothetical protein L0337_19455 [candidate division KSB1 bacterium]|nr:hypothetical protein [candidate division KSB1 bacterium]